MWWRDFQRFTAGCAILLACTICPYLLLAGGLAYGCYRLLPRREKP